MRRIVPGILAFLSVLHGGAQDSGPSAITVVLPGKGWTLGKSKLSKGQEVPRNSEIAGDAAESVDLVLECGKGGWLSYSCEKPPCNVTACRTKADDVKVQRVDPITPGEVSSESSGKSLFASLFKREPAAMAVLGVRGSEGGYLTDAIIAITGNEVHLGPALIRLLEGKYCFRLKPLPPGDAAAIRTDTMDWDRSTDSEGLVQIPNLSRGLYTLEKSSTAAAGACTFEPDATPVWVLVAPDADFASLNSQWKDYKAQILQMERSGASPTVLLTIRHAVLAHLADSANGK